MNILFYTPVNFRCRDIESLAQKFAGKGHRVYLLSQCPEGPLHRAMKNIGAETFALDAPDGSLWKTFVTARRVARFCRKNRINVCFSHLEPTNFISVLVQYFVKTRFIIYRHHVDEARLSGFEKSFSYRLTYRLAKTIVCVSNQARQFMIAEEHVPADKIHHINLGYNFSLYELPHPRNIMSIREGFPKGIVLLFAGRLNQLKRPSLCIETVRRALNENIECSLVFLGVGQEESVLREQARKYGIEDRVLFMGYALNVLDYMAASDVLIHPSLLESSCVVVKEASLVGLPVIVCKGIGDFDDYMKNNENGIVVARENFVDEALVALRGYQSDRERYRQMGVNLRADIISRFHIDMTIDRYYRLIDA